jgi:hypothetical protein
MHIALGYRPAVAMLSGTVRPVRVGRDADLSGQIGQNRSAVQRPGTHASGRTALLGIVRPARYGGPSTALTEWM